VPWPTGPQKQFLESDARFKSFVGGVGSGKTWAGCLNAMMQPPSVGMVLAATYPMLRDATLPMFMGLAHSIGLVAGFLKSEMAVTLTNGVTALFRPTDNPERLRGPNLGWFYMDVRSRAGPGSRPRRGGRTGSTNCSGATPAPGTT
jgi:phage terminase large subunit-like protein